jgi:hypothetical protein
VAANTVAVDFSVVPHRFAASIGNGTLTSIAVTHAPIASQDAVWQVYDNSTLAQVECDVVHTSSTVTTFNFIVAPTTNQYRVVGIG